VFQVLQRKFDEFQKDMASQEFRVSDVCETADRLYGDQHPESEIVIGKHLIVIGKHLIVIGKHPIVIGKHLIVIGKHLIVIGKHPSLFLLELQTDN
jgi:hypothetical protein